MKLKKSAGILLHKRANDQLFVLLVYPEGPFWVYKLAGHWSYQKENLAMKTM